MDQNSKNSVQGDIKDHLANERTFLAWIRTSIGLMAFGFVVEKFDYFVKEVGYFLLKEQAPHTNGLQNYSHVFGITIVALGALVGVFSYIQYAKTTKQIEDGGYLPSTALLAALAAVVVLMGVILVVYLA